jgi:ABC-type branched-subunit amino acid transport system substrate-binding protein
LPNTRLQYAFRDSKRDQSAAFEGVLSLTRDTFGGEGVSAIVGAASSGASISAALVTAQQQVPQISYSSTSALLSDGHKYSYFLRTPPSDAFQAIGQADLIKNLFGYTRVATASSLDGYGSAGIAAFHQEAASVGITVITSVTFDNNANDFSSQYAELQRSNAHVIVLFCQASDAGPFMLGAYNYGIGGPGFMWFGSDAVTQSDTWLNNGVLVDDALRLNVMKGFFGLTPSIGQGTALYEGYMERVRSSPATDGNGTLCNLATDDDGTLIWAHDHDGNASTPIECGSNDNQDEDSWAPFAYDAVYALAHALHNLIEVQGKTTIAGSELMDALVSDVSFPGVTGIIDFHDASTHPDRLYHGDRRVGIAYDVFNYADNANGLVRVGAWTPGTDTAFVQRWTQLGNLTYSTVNNSRPVEATDVCPPGMVTAQGMCEECPEDTYETNGRCTRCVRACPLNE